MIGRKFGLFGTDNVIEVTGESGDYWIVTISSTGGTITDVLFGKQSLNDSLHERTLQPL